MTAQQSTPPAIKRLNWGCGGSGEPGWINSDLKDGPGIQITADIRDGLPLDSESLDYIVSIHALPMISYPDLVPVLREMHRMLKPDGVLRLALPDLDRSIQAYLRRDPGFFLVPDADVESYSGKFITHLLWYGYSVTLFTADFIEELLWKSGYRHVGQCSFEQTASSHAPGILELDNREAESLFVEGVK
jgi:SAM-dependent methyltransferase